MRALGISLPMVAIEHPLGGERSDGVSRRARQAVDQIRGLLGRAPGAETMATGGIGRAEPASVLATGEIRRAEPTSASLRPPSVQAGLTDPVTIEDTAEA